MKSPNLSAALSQLQNKDPDFSKDAFEKFARETFMALQSAWTNKEWDKVRPLETDFLFQQHQYWMDCYKHDGLRNVLEDIEITRIDWARIDLDKFFESVTIRM